MTSSSYPTQEDELRAKEANADDSKGIEEARFLETFSSASGKSGQRLSQLSQTITDTFNRVMAESRFEPYERQEDLMVGLKKMLMEEIHVINARRRYAMKLNPSTVASQDAAAQKNGDGNMRRQ